MDLLAGIVTLALLAGVVLPMLARSKARGSRINCTNNLKQVGIAFRTWELDNRDLYPMQVAVTNGGTMGLTNAGQAYVHFLVMSNELSTPMLLLCPEDTRPRTNAYTFGKGFSDLNLSYFVGVDAQDTHPQMILSGDDNLTESAKPLPAGLNNLWTNSNLGWGKPRHAGSGNLVLADGAVIQVPAAGLRAAFAASGNPTNRLLLP